MESVRRSLEPVHSWLTLIAENRTGQAENLSDQKAGTRGCVRLHREVLPSNAPPFYHRVSKPYDLRGASYESLSCRPQNRLQARTDPGRRVIERGAAEVYQLTVSAASSAKAIRLG